MSDWPDLQWAECVTITPLSLEGMGPFQAAAANASMPGGSNAAWPAANLALYFPFYIPRSLAVTTLFIATGTGAANLDIGIYDESGTRVVSTGSTAKVTSSVQQITISETIIGPGLMYLAMASDSGTPSTFGRVQCTSVPALRMAGPAQQASAFPLPAAATFAAIANNYIPVCGLTGRSL